MMTINSLLVLFTLFAALFNIVFALNLRLDVFNLGSRWINTDRSETFNNVNSTKNRTVNAAFHQNTTSTNVIVAKDNPSNKNTTLAVTSTKSWLSLTLIILLALGIIVVIVICVYLVFISKERKSLSKTESAGAKKSKESVSLKAASHPSFDADVIYLKSKDEERKREKVLNKILGKDTAPGDDDKFPEFNIPKPLTAKQKRRKKAILTKSRTDTTLKKLKKTRKGSKRNTGDNTA